MRFHTTSDAFNFSWEQVSQAFWRRYPNPQSSHVLSEDVVARFVAKDGSLVTKRLLTKTNRMPRFGEMIVGKVNSSVKVVEESVVDPVSRTMTTYTRNIGMTNIMQVEEKCVYRPDPSAPLQRTTCERQVWVSSNLTGVSRAVTKFGIERFKANAHKASFGLVFIMENLFGAAASNGGHHHHHLATVGGSGHNRAMQQATEKLKEKAKLAKEMAKSQIPVVQAAAADSSSSSSS